MAALLLLMQRALAAAPASVLAYSAAVLWGLVAVVIEQRASSLPGATSSAGVAVGLFVAVALHGAWLLRRARVAQAEALHAAPSLRRWSGRPWPTLFASAT